MAPQVAARPYLRVRQVATHLDLSIQRIYQMINEGTFPWKYRRSGRAIFVDASDFFGAAGNRVDERGGEKASSLSAVA